MHFVKTTKNWCQRIEVLSQYLYYCYSPPSFNLMCSVEEVCHLLVRQWRTFVSYLSDNGGILSVT